MLKEGDYLDPFNRQDAMEIIAFADMANFQMHEQRRRDHRASMYGPYGLCFNTLRLTGSDAKDGRALTKRSFINHIANSDKEESCLVSTLWKLGIEPGAIVRNKGNSAYAFIVPPYTMWSKFGDAYSWPLKDSAPHSNCILNMHTELLLHDSEVHAEGVEVSELQVGQWVRLKSKATSRIFKVTEVSTGKVSVKLNDGLWNLVHELLAVSGANVIEAKKPVSLPEEDDVIRVGDTVTILEDDGSKLHLPYLGKHVVVVEIEPGDAGNERCDIIRYSRGIGLPIGMFRYRFKKIKAGGPVSTKSKPSSDEQVHRKAEKERGTVEGRCIQRSAPGRSCATGSRHTGHRARAAVSRSQCRTGAIRFTIQRS
jgi:hypothetical protein